MTLYLYEFYEIFSFDFPSFLVTFVKAKKAHFILLTVVVLLACIEMVVDFLVFIHLLVVVIIAVHGKTKTKMAKENTSGRMEHAKSS